MVYSFEVEKASIYVNKRQKTLAAIKQETGCDVIINGGLFDMSYNDRPNLWLRVDGKTLNTDKYGYWCYGWNTNDIRMIHSNDIETVKNAICCCSMVKDSKPTQMFTNSATGGKRGRTAMGTLPNGKVIIYVSKDGTKDAMTPEALQEYCLANGWKDAIMLDSGGSSQCITPEGTITSTRKVHNVICFWLKPTTEGNDEAMNGAGVKVYSKVKDGTTKLSTNFKVKEFACSDGTDPIFISPELVTVLQKIRTHFGKAVTINSAYRTPAKNKAVGGATYSQHLYGTAADISIKGVSPKTVAAYVETIMPNKGGIGIYSTFTHVDVRKTKSRWNG